MERTRVLGTSWQRIQPPITDAGEAGEGSEVEEGNRRAPALYTEGT